MKAPVVHHVGDASAAALRLRKLLTALWERSWLVALCVLLGGGLAGLYLYRVPPVYAATAVIQYDTTASGLPDLAGGGSADLGERSLERHLKEVRRVLLNPDLLRRVAEAAKLAAHPYFGGAGAPGTATADQAIERLRQAVQVELPPEDVIISVTVTTPDARLCADLANRLCEEVIALDVRSRQANQQKETKRLKEMVTQLRREYDENEKELDDKRQQSEGVAVQQRQLLRSLEDSTRRLADAGERRVQLKIECDRIARQGTNVEGLLRIPIIATNATVAAAQNALAPKEAAFAELTQRYKEKHPKYAEAKAELDQLRSQLADAVNNAARALQALLPEAQQQEASIRRESEAKRLEAAATEEQMKSSTNVLFNRQLTLVMEIYNKVVQRQKEVELASGFTSSPLRVIQTAEIPSRPSGPNWTRILLAGAGGGFVLGLLLSLVFGLGDTSFKGVDEAEMVLRLPVLGVVPVLRNEETEMAAAEGFRSLRTSISVLSKGNEPRSILFTSTSPDEGKTFCALNFAVGLAQQGMRTVLIECDLRRPMAAPSLTRVKIDHAGVSDYLRKSQPKGPAHPGLKAAAPKPELSFAEVRRKQRESGGDAPAATPEPADAQAIAYNPLALDEVLQPTEIENLAFISAGTPVSNPSELLAQPTFTHLVGELLKRFDRVVIDSAPMLGISDTLLLSNRVQALCFVVRANQTPRRAVARAVEILKRADAPIAGLVLNGLTPKKSDPYGQNYYYYHRGDQQRGKN